jgi:putative aldouronate transport system substrate-binding protein
MKRIIRAFKVSLSALIAIMMVLVLVLSGCGSNDNKETVTPDESSTQEPSTRETEAPPEPVEITWGVHFQATGVYENTLVQEWLEEKFNVKIKPVKVTDASIASGEVPDIFTLGDPSNVAAYQAQGVLMPIDENMLSTKLPEYYKDINQISPELFKTVTFNDALWGIPMFVTLRGYDFAMLWRKDWLDNVEITKIPETLEEFEEAVYAFAKDDPDGNGEADTYGLTGTMTTTWSSGFYSIFGAYGVETDMWFIKDGQVVNGSIMPETKDALATLRKWYADGVLDPEFITETQSGYMEKLVNGRIGVVEAMISDGAIPTSGIMTSMKDADSNAVLSLGKNPKGPGGDGSWCWGSKSNFVVFGSQVEGQLDKLDKLFEILEAQSIDEETANMVGMGIKGKHWDFVETGADSGPTQFLEGYEQGEVRDQEGIGLFSLGAIQTLGIREKYMDSRVVEAIKTYGSENRWEDALLFSVLPSEGEYKADLTKLMQQYYAEIITGERPLDDFDEFVEEWNTRGGNILTKEANDFYQEQFKE